MNRFTRTALALLATCSSLLAGNLPAVETAPLKPFTEAAAAAEQAMQHHLYDRSWLDQAEFVSLQAKIETLAAQPQSREDFVRDFNALWSLGPFSHVQLNPARGSAEQMAAYVDQLRVGGGGARLTWQEDVALLTVDTMMGLDTIEEVHAAFVEIAGRPAQALIIDLRANKGGAFVSRALISHVVDRPADIGMFTSRRWNESQRLAPTIEQVQALAPWDGWTLTSFWRDVQAQPLTRIQVQPQAPFYRGPIVVLVSRQTASAAELTADALRQAGQALLIGEHTAGAMLSQAPFDLPDGLQLMLPIADYLSHQSGRIEGRGLRPDIAVAAEQAMAVALERLAK